MNETRHGRPAAWSEAMSGAAMRCGRWFRRHARVLCIILLVACAVEVFGFNHYFWSTMGSTAIEQPKAVLGDGSDLKYGTTYQSDDGIALTVYPTSDATGAVDVESIDLKVSQTAEDGDGETVEYKPYGSATEDGTGTGGKSLLIIPNPTYDSWDNCHLTERITVYDEGHAEGHAVGPVDSGTSSWRGMNANGLDDDGAHVVCPAVQSSMYRSLKAAGAVSKIELDFHDAASEDLSLRIDSITLNEHVPMRFNILRVLLMALVTAGLLCLFERRSDRIKSFVVGIPPVDTGTRPSDDGATQAPAAERGGQVDGSRAGGTALDLEPQWRIVWALVLLGSLVGAVLLQMQAAETCVFPTYSQLTHSLTEGRIDIDYPWGEDKADIIRGMSNPYDTGERYKLAAPLLYDIAFHAGKFYLYFGIVPELLLFLPWYLLTGMDLSSTQALCVFDVALVIGGFLLVNELRRRLCPSMPRGLLMLLSVIVPGTILSFTMKTASVHPIANISGLAFVFWGLWLWLRSVRGVDSRGRGLSVWRAALGSLCMALAVGCRPTMALYSLLAFPVFWRVLVRPRSNWWRVLLAVLPYVPVAAGLMWYNAARFGSPFEFGTRYQLTGEDVLHQGVHLSRVPLGLWYYLFMPPKLIPEYPYISALGVTTRYSGFIDVWFVRGGLFFIVPLLLILLVPAAVRRLKKTRALYVLCMVLAVVTTGVETIFGAIFTRYMCDIAPFLLIAALCVVMEWLQDAAQRGDAAVAMRRYRVACVLTVLTVLMLVLGFFCIDEESNVSPFGNYPFYFRMWDFFDLLKY